MYIEAIKQLLDKADLQDQESIVDSLNKVVNYINRVIQEAPLLMRAGINMDQQDYIEYAQTLYAARNRLHDIACEGIDALNNIYNRYITYPPLFEDFKLVKANDPTNTVQYDANTHRIVSNIGAVLCNEFYHESTYTLERFLIDKIAGKDQNLYDALDMQTLQSKTKDYIQKHYRIDLQESVDKATTDYVEFACYDGTEIALYTGKDNKLGNAEWDSYGHLYCTDCQVTQAEYSPLTMGDAFIYFDSDGIGSDVPMKMVEEMIKLHGGIKEIDAIDMSMEKQLYEAGKDKFTCFLTEHGIAFTPVNSPDLSIEFYKNEHKIIHQESGRNITADAFNSLLLHNDTRAVYDELRQIHDTYTERHSWQLER